MSHVTHESPRAYEAATKVDPLILAKALDHIARTAARSRSRTRRLRWIEQRALIALRGDEFRDLDIDLPKSAGPDTQEKLQRRMAYHIAIKHQLIEALQPFVVFNSSEETITITVRTEDVRRARAALAAGSPA